MSSNVVGDTSMTPIDQAKPVVAKKVKPPARDRSKSVNKELFGNVPTLPTMKSMIGEPVHPMQVQTSIIEQEVIDVDGLKKADDTQQTQKAEKKVMKKMKRFFHPLSLNAPVVFSFADEFDNYKKDHQVMDPFEFEKFQKRKEYKERRMMLDKNQNKQKEGEIDVDDAREASAWGHGGGHHTDFNQIIKQLEANIKATGTLGHGKMYAKHQNNLKKKKKKPKKQPVLGEDGKPVELPSGQEPTSEAGPEMDENYYDLDDDFIDDSGVQEDLITEDFLIHDPAAQSSLHSQDNNEEGKEEGAKESDEESEEYKVDRSLVDFYHLFKAYSPQEVRNMIDKEVKLKKDQQAAIEQIQAKLEGKTDGNQPEQAQFQNKKRTLEQMESFVHSNFPHEVMQAILSIRNSNLTAQISSHDKQLTIIARQFINVDAIDYREDQELLTNVSHQLASIFNKSANEMKYNIKRKAFTELKQKNKVKKLDKISILSRILERCKDRFNKDMTLNEVYKVFDSEENFPHLVEIWQSFLDKVVNQSLVISKCKLKEDRAKGKKMIRDTAAQDQILSRDELFQQEVINDVGCILKTDELESEVKEKLYEAFVHKFELTLAPHTLQETFKFKIQPAKKSVDPRKANQQSGEEEKVQASPKKNQGATPKKTAKDPVLKSKVDVDLTMTEEVSPDLKKNSITPTITTQATPTLNASPQKPQTMQKQIAGQKAPVPSLPKVQSPSKQVPMFAVTKSQVLPTLGNVFKRINLEKFANK